MLQLEILYTHACMGVDMPTQLTLMCPSDLSISPCVGEYVLDNLAQHFCVFEVWIKLIVYSFLVIFV